jgi:hypothetical protein
MESIETPPPVPHHDPAQPAEHSPKKKKRFILFGGLLLVLLAAGLLALQMIPPPALSPTPPTIGDTEVSTAPVDTQQEHALPQHVYVNKKYNFTFRYRENEYYNGILSNDFHLDEFGKTILITENVYNSDSTTTTIPIEYKIIDASPEDKKNLLAWWKKTHKTDFGGHKVPDEYDTSVNTAAFVGCIRSFQKGWQLPPTLEVLAKGAIETDAMEAAESPEATEEPIDPTRIMYMYFDFGKPFIMRFEEPNNGGCGAKDTHLPIASLKRLK